jgi:RNA polymerase sigma factor (TIGR02999 family)
MKDVTEILSQIQSGDGLASEQLLPLVYDELRKLAAQRMVQENAGQTLQPTALVHEAYLRLVGAAPTQQWDGRGHFFAAAAEAMRRILIESARRKGRIKHGGDGIRMELDEVNVASPGRPEFLLALDGALDKLGEANPQAAELIKLRYFAGFTNAEAASLLGVSPRKATQIWAYARAWLLEELGHSDQ